MMFKLKNTLITNKNSVSTTNLHLDRQSNYCLTLSKTYLIRYKFYELTKLSILSINTI